MTDDDDDDDGADDDDDDDDEDDDDDDVDDDDEDDEDGNPGRSRLGLCERLRFVPLLEDASPSVVASVVPAVVASCAMRAPTGRVHVVSPVTTFQ
jgi:trigger factor